MTEGTGQTMSGVSRRTFLKAAPAVAAATGVVATGLGGLEAATLAPASAATGTSASTSPGIVVPSGWGQFAGPKLSAAAAGTGRATVALVGDSICRGCFSSNLDYRGWGGLVAQSLRQSYNDGGSGFRSTADSSTWMQGVSGLSASSTISYYQSAGNLFTVSGNWAAKTANWIGPGGVALQTGDSSASLSVTVRGTTAKVLWLDGGAGSFGPFTVTIDGGSPVLVKPSGIYRIAVTRLTGLSGGSHTLQITATGATSSTQVVIIGVAGENDTGCVVNQFSRYGQNTANLNNSDQMVSGTWHGGWNYPADLVVYALAANDARANVSGDTWAKNVRCWLGGVYDTTYGGTSTGGVDGILVLSHIGRYDNGEYVYQDYTVRAAGIAQAFGLLFIDMWSLGRNSWNYWKTQSAGSYWANADSPGHSGSDVVHLSDVGHQYMATTVINAITASLP